MTPQTALLTATAVHAGFQVTVTVLVYPALARVPAHRWADAHRAHSRAILPLVVVVYSALAVTGGWTLASGPGAWAVTTLAALTVAVAVTALAAAPAHGRLGAGHDPVVVRRLLNADRVRAVAAVVAAVAAVLAL